MTTKIDPATYLTKAELKFVKKELADKPKDWILDQLTTHLQTAIWIELATIPIYLYTYYSLERTDYSGRQMRPADVFANKAGGIIMSVAVEEMLHLSLSCNVYYSLTGTPPVLYRKSPGPYPTPLPHHNPQGPPGPGGPSDTQVKIPLSRFTYDQLWHFLQIESPERQDAKPQADDWDTIGQFYSYIRCLVYSLDDSYFQTGPADYQIASTNYSPNSIDTGYPEQPFDPWGYPPGQGETGDGEVVDGYPTAAEATQFPNSPDASARPPDRGAPAHELQTVSSQIDALQAIATICDQGEGFQHERFDDPGQLEESHYYKFLTLQAQLEQYLTHIEQLPKKPKPPDPVAPTVGQAELDEVVVNFPDNPTSADYGKYQPLADFVSGLYQYMLIMTESLFKVQFVGDDMPVSDEHPVLANQKMFFNNGMHYSMIWMLDKIIQAMRRHCLSNGWAVAPTFENIDLGPRHGARDELLKLGNKMSGQDYWSSFQSYVAMVSHLPDVADLWPDEHEAKVTPAAPAGTAQPTGPGYPVPVPYPYADAPVYPGASWDGEPPGIGPQPPNLPLHACMGLNSCKAADRYGTVGRPTAANPHPTTSNPGETNACAGQGYCSTTPDHTCHVKNECRHQGGCGLYGTAEELDNPGRNSCKGLGSCATPINAERFSTNGPNQGKSVWKRARQVFDEAWTPEYVTELREKGVDAPDELGPVPAPFTEHGPAYLWISHDNAQRFNMTACGSSGLSGAGGCS